jgi:glycosyltransferase involved in cell wall biosynthesis
MKFTIFTHVPHFYLDEKYFAYAPYVREMDFWFNKVDEIEIIAPLKKYNRSDLLLSYKEQSKIIFREIPELHFKSLKSIVPTIISIPKIIIKIFRLMNSSDHIHLRCPGNIGLLAVIAQIFFPSKTKTAKYAGNWDPESKQPFSYKIQRWILSNTFLTRNTSVLIYGNWNEKNINLIPFFTGSYSENDIDNSNKEFSKPYKFIFVGSLVEGKRPLLSIQVVQSLITKGIDARLDIYGKGECGKALAEYINKNNLNKYVRMHGNQDAELLKKAYSKSHFSLLPSKSEGWPKALAEAMFHGCIPIGTQISCVPWMLDYGKRGILIEPSVDLATNELLKYLGKQDELKKLSHRAREWSQKYTIEKFNREIRKLL